MPKATKVKKRSPEKNYKLLLSFNAEEKQRLEAVEKRRGIPRSILLKSYLKEDANRLGIP
jgi:hypothetical protein